MIKLPIGPLWIALMFALALAFSATAFADGPPVKKGKNGICHAVGNRPVAANVRQRPHVGSPVVR
ncbi:hypothetical protein T35B1_08664 [Salinisphaera shabanensis T35B1]